MSGATRIGRFVVVVLTMIGAAEARDSDPPARQQTRPSTPGLCNLIARPDLEKLVGRKVISVRYAEPRVGGKVCGYQLASRPDEWLKYLELIVSHYLLENPETALRAATNGNCDYADGGLYPIEVNKGRAFTCFSYATGERNNGLQVTVVRDRRVIEIYYSLVDGSGRTPAVANFAKPLVQPSAEIGSRILDLWNPR